MVDLAATRFLVMPSPFENREKLIKLEYGEILPQFERPAIVDNDRLVPDHDGNVQHTFDCEANLDASSLADNNFMMRDRKTHL